MPPLVIEAIGYAAATLTTVAFVPQVLRTWRSRSADDLSPGMLAMFTTGIFLWLVYGLAAGARPLAAANAVTLVLSLALVVMRVRFGGRSPARRDRDPGA
jgi:MtN3 and saliva related transmembrane protein